MINKIDVENWQTESGQNESKDYFKMSCCFIDAAHEALVKSEITKEAKNYWLDDAERCIAMAENMVSEIKNKKIKAFQNTHIDAIRQLIKVQGELK